MYKYERVPLRKKYSTTYMTGDSIKEIRNNADSELRKKIAGSAQTNYL